MNTVLLTGAGFSFNWGAQFAREVNTAVARRVSNDANLAALLQRNPNFEEALAELQNAVAQSSDAGRHRLWAFACTGNQMGHWNLAGCRSDIPDPLVVGGYNVLRTHWRPVASPRSTVIGPRHQPYYKLHGSTNWRDPSGGHLLVMGGNKPTAMQRQPILTWYAGKFVEAVSKPNARLMIIGYGFRDSHINRMICEGREKGGETLSMFIVQPDGREILKKVNPTYGKFYAPGPLEAITVYDSTRPFRSTFETDAAEHEILIDYAAGR